MEVWVELNSRHYAQGFIVHPKNIHRIHYSSWYYSLKLQYSIIGNADIIHNILSIQTNHIHYSYWCQLFPIF